MVFNIIDIWMDVSYRYFIQIGIYEIFILTNGDILKYDKIIINM